MMNEPLHIRWLGRVPYKEALAVQEAMYVSKRGQQLLLLEHDHVFTYGPSADLVNNLKCQPEDVGADFVSVKRGGDITYHGPGQLVGYPIVTLPPKRGERGPADPVSYVWSDIPECGWVVMQGHRARFAQ
jgi:lipoic acid synthetase